MMHNGKFIRKNDRISLGQMEDDGRHQHQRIHAGSSEQSVPSGKHTKNYGKSPFLTINSHFQWQTVKLPEGTVCPNTVSFLQKRCFPGRIRKMTWPIGTKFQTLSLYRHSIEVHEGSEQETHGFSPWKKIGALWNCRSTSFNIFQPILPRIRISLACRFPG